MKLNPQPPLGLLAVVKIINTWNFLPVIRNLLLMEDTKSLLMMVLQKVFHSRPKIVEDTFQLIYNYNNGKREKKGYEKTLKTICDLMNGELSSQILVYLLTMVDMPKEGGYQLPIMEKMQKTHGCLAESVRPHLLECLRSKKSEANGHPSVENILEESTCEKKLENKNEITKTKEESPVKKSSSSEDDCFLKPAKRPKKLIRGSRKTQRNNNTASSDQEILPSLTDICASFCVRNEKKLRKMYKTKLDKTWAMVNGNQLSGQHLNKCYEVIRYLNRMMKLVRMIENSEVTTELLMEEYTDVDIFIREKHLQNYLKWDPFEGM